MNGSKMPSLFDLHCDTAHELYRGGKSLLNNSLHIDIERLSRFDKAVQVFAVWTPDTLQGAERYENALRVIDAFGVQVAKNADRIALCGSYDDIVAAHSKGKIAALLGVEGAGCFDGRLDTIKTLYEKGVRIVTVTWNGKNELASGVPDEGGLTDYGKKVLDEMAKLRMIADLSHANRRSFEEITDYYNGPMIASHSNCYEVCAHLRNLTASQREKIGLIGLNLYPVFVKMGAKMSDLLLHLEHFCPEKCALGCDFDGVDALPEGISGVQDLPKLYDLVKNWQGNDYANHLFFDNAMEYMKKHLR